jgi:hypothetical protein
VVWGFQPVCYSTVPHHFIRQIFTGGEAMKRLFGHQSYWYVGATLTLRLLGWVGVEQATAQVSFGPIQGAVPRGLGVTVYTAPSQQAQEHVDYVNATSMPLPKAPRGSAAQAQDDLIATLASQITLVESGGSVAGSNGTGAVDPVSLGVPRPTTNDSEEVTPEEFGIANHSELTPCRHNANC